MAWRSSRRALRSIGHPVHAARRWPDRFLRYVQESTDRTGNVDTLRALSWIDRPEGRALLVVVSESPDLLTLQGPLAAYTAVVKRLGAAHAGSLGHRDEWRP
jgi:hypothetical protein